MAELSLWQRLKNLVVLDAKSEKIQDEIKLLEEQIKEEKLIIPRLQEKIASLKQAKHDAKKNVDMQELHAEELKNRETSKRDALENVKNQKEFASVEKEIASLAHQIAEQDDLVFKAWHNLELAEKAAKTETEQLNEKIEQLEKAASQEKEKIVALKQEITDLEGQKKERAKEIPTDWLERYTHMRERVPDPIVPVLRESCSSCYYSVPPQDLSRLKREAVLPCRSCYRFLYFDAVEEKESETPSF